MNFKLWLGWWTHRRRVILTMYDGDVKIVKVYYTGTQMLARWIGLDKSWSILEKDGKVRGTSLVHKWEPLGVWEDE